MAQLVIMPTDHNHPDPLRDRAGCYKSGDVVAVFDDAHQFSADDHAAFNIVSLPGEVSEYAYLQSPDTRIDITPAALQNPALMAAMVRNTPARLITRRRYRYDPVQGLEIKHA